MAPDKWYRMLLTLEKLSLQVFSTRDSQIASTTAEVRQTRRRCGSASNEYIHVHKVVTTRPRVEGTDVVCLICRQKMALTLAKNDDRSCPSKHAQSDTSSLGYVSVFVSIEWHVVCYDMGCEISGLRMTDV